MDLSYYEPFGGSTKGIIKEMSGIGISGMDSLEEGAGEVFSMGVSSIITFAGAKKGRLLVDMEKSLALYMAGTVLGGEYEDVKDPMVLGVVSEINNIVAGDAITKLNNMYSLGLRLAPPVVFAGDDIIIAIPKLKTLSSYGDTDYGKIRINIAWEGGAN